MVTDSLVSVTDPNVLFILYDSTSKKTLSPIIKKIEADVSILFLDKLFLKTTGSNGSPLAREYHPTFEAADYLKNGNVLEIKRENNFVGSILKTPIMFIENKLPGLFYSINEVYNDTNPDIIISGHDTMPFIRDLIKEAYDDSVPTIIIQHGVDRENLEVGTDAGHFLSPSAQPKYWLIELLKRRIGYEYGAFTFCNPYVAEVHTFGDFFTQRISQLRAQPPTSFAPSIVTTGSTEYNPNFVSSVSKDTKSAVFLSQWQYERGHWGEKKQQWVVDALNQIRKVNDIDITVRPHPKESETKINHFFSQFCIDTSTNLNQIIDSHDVTISFDSTAVFPAVVAGKPVGILNPPWGNSYEPFVHDYLIQLGNQKFDLDCRLPSGTLQRDYLQKYFYTPALDDNSAYDTPVELSISRIDDFL